MIAEILSIGDELTAGAILDTNAWESAIWFQELGLRVLRHVTIGDDMDAIVTAFRTAIERADVVFASGGLGPTADDLTRAALAQAVGVELEFFPEAYEHTKNLFARRGRPMPEQNRSQAISPKGTRHIPNPDGTALGVDLTVVREGRSPCRVFCVPGVPAEMRVCRQSIDRTLREELGLGRRKIVHRKIHCFGAGESQIEAMLPDLIRRGRIPQVGITANDGSISLRMMAEGDSSAECAEQIEPTARIIYDTLGSLVYGEGEVTLADVVVSQLREQQASLSVLEIGVAGCIFNEANTARIAAFQGELFSDLSAFSKHLQLLPPSECAYSALDSGIFSAEGETVERRWVAMAAHLTRKQRQTDWAVAIVRFPEDWADLSNGAVCSRCAVEAKGDSASPNGGGNAGFRDDLVLHDPERATSVFIAVVGPDQQCRICTASRLGHPAIRDIYVAKTAWNALRLQLLSNH